MQFIIRDLSADPPHVSKDRFLLIVSNREGGCVLTSNDVMFISIPLKIGKHFKTLKRHQSCVTINITSIKSILNKQTVRQKYRRL